jgi:hypothetical protein
MQCESARCQVRKPKDQALEVLNYQVDVNSVNANLMISFYIEQISPSL